MTGGEGRERPTSGKGGGIIKYENLEAGL